METTIQMFISRHHEIKSDKKSFLFTVNYIFYIYIFLAEALGQEGFQLFLNAGQEVDENLVNALIKEVLQEKVQNAVGQRTSRDDEGMKYSGGGVSRKQKPDKVIAATPRTTTTTTTVQAPNSTTQVKRVASPPMVSH